MSISKCALLLGLLTIALTSKIGTAKEVDLEVEPSYASALLNQVPIAVPKGEVLRVITAYSSRTKETDDTPFITAAGTKVRPGVVAANWLPLGAKIKIPEIFGDKVFTVEDRMHEKNSHKVDIWFGTTEDAINFGIKTAKIQIL